VLIRDEKWFKSNTLPKSDWSNIKQFRAMREQMDKDRLQALGSPGPHVEEEFKTITMRDGFESQIKIHRPAAKTGGPLLVLVYGGGFVVGNNQQLVSDTCEFKMAEDVDVEIDTLRTRLCQGL
jgi:carboxylesterase type B